KSNLKRQNYAPAACGAGPSCTTQKNPAIIFFFGARRWRYQNAGVAQLVERNLAKVEVASSRLVSRSRIQSEACYLAIKQIPKKQKSRKAENLFSAFFVSSLLRSVSTSEFAVNFLTNLGA